MSSNDKSYVKINYASDAVVVQVPRPRAKNVSQDSSVINYTNLLCDQSTSRNRNPYCASSVSSSSYSECSGCPSSNFQCRETSATKILADLN